MENKFKIIVLLLSVIMLMCISCGNSSGKGLQISNDDEVSVEYDFGNYGWDYLLNETEEEEPEEPEPEYEYLVDLFEDVEDWLTFSGAGKEGEVKLTIPEDYSREINGLYIKRDYYTNVVKFIYDNKELGTFSYYIYNGSDYWSSYANNFSAGDTVTIFKGSKDITNLNNNLLENGFYIKETEYQFSYPDRGSYITNCGDAIKVRDVLGTMAHKFYCEKEKIDTNSEEAENIVALPKHAKYGQIKPDEVLNSEGMRVIVAVPLWNRERDSYNLAYMTDIVIDSEGGEDGKYSEEDVRVEWCVVSTYIRAIP